MQIKGKRILKNGRTGAYVRQRDGSWRFRFISSGGNGNELNNNNNKILKNYKNLLQKKSKTYGIFSLSPRKKILCLIY